MMKIWKVAPQLLLVGATAACGPALVVGSGAVVTRSVLQERAMIDAFNDTETAFSIETRLGEHSGELYRDVSVDVVEGRVTLTGSVPRRRDRVDAEQIAWIPENVVSVANEITVAEDTGTRAYWQDVSISTQLRYALIADGGVASLNYNVETVDRVVHVTGIARSPRELDRVVRHAQRTEGVAHVVSHVLLIDDPRRFATRRAGRDTAKGRAAGDAVAGADGTLTASAPQATGPTIDTSPGRPGDGPVEARPLD